MYMADAERAEYLDKLIGCNIILKTMSLKELKDLRKKTSK